MQPTAKTVHDYCLHLLARREHSRKELLTKCQKKGFAVADILPVLNELSEKGYQSDTRYAQSYARSRLNKGYGGLAIAYQLKQQGIDDFDFNALLTENETDWLAQIERVYCKKFTEQQLPTAQEWAKRSRFLQQRGFSLALINQFRKKLRQPSYE